MFVRMLSGVALLACLAAPSVARAQFNQYWLPVEQGLLDSHVDVQLQYSRPEGLGGDDLNVAVLSIEGQWAFSDRFEVGLDVPVLTHDYATGFAPAEEDTSFGNVMLNLKLKLFSLGESFSLAVYNNIMLPTHSGLDDHKYTMMIPGGAITGKLLGLLLGGGVGALWFISDGDDFALMTLDAYAGYSLFGILTFKLAAQFANSLHPDGDINALALTPGVEVDLLDIVRVGAAARIATNDDAKVIFGGRAVLLVHGGVSF